MSSIAEDTVSTSVAPALAQLAPGTYCFHRSWGYGKIREHNLDQEQVTIDFKTKKNHSMAFDYALSSLVSLPNTHIVARKSESLDAVKQLAKEDELALARCCIESFGAQATTDVIHDALVPDVMPETAWKKWWDSAKRAMRKDGLYHIAAKKNEAFRVLEVKVEVGSQALEKFRKATGLEQLLAATSQVIKNWSEIKDPEFVREVVEVINTALPKAPRSQLYLVVELAIARDELLLAAELPLNDEQQGLLTLIPSTPRAFADVLEKISGPRQLKLLRAMQDRGNENWATLLLQVLPYATARMADSVTTIFAAAGRADEVVNALRRQIIERNVSSDMLYWLCKHRDELFAPLFEPNLIMAILSVLEKDIFADIKKGTKLYDLMHSDKELIAALLKDAESDDVRDVTRGIILSPVFQELDKRSLLATIIKLFPDMQELVIGTDKNQQSNVASILIVSWPSLEKRSLELEELITKKIPQNSKDIELARSYGDLRENSEFKSAKEMQSVLMKRKEELENDLARAQGTDFSDVDISAVNPGTIVTVQEVASSKRKSYTILGAWDSDPAKGVVSYLTPLANALMKEKVGSHVSLTTEDGAELKVIIEKIEAYKA